MRLARTNPTAWIKADSLCQRPASMAGAFCFRGRGKVVKSALEFHSILYRNTSDHAERPVVTPAFFRDLNLDQIVGAIIAGRENFDLEPFFTTPLADPDAVRYRQAVMRDLEEPGLKAGVKAFSAGMQEVARQLAVASEAGPQAWREGWMLEATLAYGDAVTGLEQCLAVSALNSQGLQAFRDFTDAYVKSATFRSLLAEARQVKLELSAVRYSLTLQPGKFSVSRFEEQPDYGAKIQATFEKFRQAEAKGYLSKLKPAGGLNHIEALILEFVARLYPEPFTALEGFCARHADFVDTRMSTFHREVQFYLAYLDFIEPIKDMGLSFCYPDITDQLDHAFARQAYDLALAHKLVYDERRVVPNSFRLDDQERIIVVTGPNQGGKTTFARMFGQLHFLASLGCAVPGRDARLSLFDQIYTHFERAEDVQSLRGKLQDDLIRIRDILQEQPQTASLSSTK